MAANEDHVSVVVLGGRATLRVFAEPGAGELPTLYDLLPESMQRALDGPPQVGTKRRRRDLAMQLAAAVKGGEGGGTAEDHGGEAAEEESPARRKRQRRLVDDESSPESSMATLPFPPLSDDRPSLDDALRSPSQDDVASQSLFSPVAVADAGRVADEFEVTKSMASALAKVELDVGRDPPSSQESDGWSTQTMLASMAAMASGPVEARARMTLEDAPSPAPVSAPAAMGGFATAGGRAVEASPAALARAKGLMAGIDDAPTSPTPTAAAAGFSTAGGRAVEASPAALARAKGLMAGIDDAPTSPTPTAAAAGFSTAGGRAVEASPAALARAKGLMAGVDDAPLSAPAAMGGFATAGGRAVEASPAALARAKGLMAGIDDAPTSPTPAATVAGFATAGGRSVKASPAAFARAKGLMAGIDDAPTSPTPAATVAGFATAGGRSVKASPAAFARAKGLMAGIDDAPTSPTPTATVAGFATAGGRSVKASPAAFARAKGLMAGIDDAPTSPTPTATVAGFATAGGRSVKASPAALARAKGLMAGIDDAPTSPTPTATVAGFATAGGRSVKASPAALARAKGLMAGIDDAPTSPTPTATVAGFATAGGRSVKASPAAFARAKGLMAGIDDAPTSPTPTATVAGFATAGGRSVKASPAAFARAKGLMAGIDDAPVSAPAAMGGFATAGGRAVEASPAALARAKGLMAGIDDAPTSPTPTAAAAGFSTAGGRSVKASPAALARAKGLMAGVDDAPLSAPAAMGGFATAGGRAVEASPAALARAKGLMAGIDDAPTSPTPTATVAGFATAGGRSVKASPAAFARAKGLMAGIDDAPTSPTPAATVAGFATAGGRSVKASPAALARAKGLMAGIDSTPATAAPVGSSPSNIVSPPESETPQLTRPGLSKLGLFSPSTISPYAASHRASRSSAKQTARDRALARFVRTNSSEGLSSGEPAEPESDSLAVVLFPDLPRSPLTTEPRAATDARRSATTSTLPGPIKTKPRIKRPKPVKHKFVKPPPPRPSLSAKPKPKDASGGIASVYDLEAHAAASGPLPPGVAAMTFALAPLYQFPETRAAGQQPVDMLYDALISRGAVAKLFSPEWVANHARLIIWKLAALCRAFPISLGESYFTYERVVNQLAFRYEKEINSAQRSAFKRILEQDDTSTRTMVVVITSVISVPSLPSPRKLAPSRNAAIAAHYGADLDGRRAPGSGSGDDESGEEADTDIYADTDALLAFLAARPGAIQISDGWYTLAASLDPGLTLRLIRGQLYPGLKLCMSGCALIGADQACSPLEAPPSAAYRLTTNSVRRARWDATLGIHPVPAMTIPLASITADGGRVPATEFVVLRVYPVVYREKILDPSVPLPPHPVSGDDDDADADKPDLPTISITRGPKAEARIDRRFALRRERRTEELVAVEQAVRDPRSASSTPVRAGSASNFRTPTRKPDPSILDGRVLLHAMHASPDPAAFFAALSPVQRSSVEASISGEREETQRAVMTVVEKKLTAERLFSRDVTPVLRLLVADARKYAAGVVSDPELAQPYLPCAPDDALAVISVWGPTDDILGTVAREGAHVRAYGLSPSRPYHRTPLATRLPNLNWNRSTRFEVLGSLADSPRFVPRVAAVPAAFHDAPPAHLQRGEARTEIPADLVGVVVGVQRLAPRGESASRLEFAALGAPAPPPASPSKSATGGTDSYHLYFATVTGALVLVQCYGSHDAYAFDELRDVAASGPRRGGTPYVVRNAVFVAHDPSFNLTIFEATQVTTVSKTVPAAYRPATAALTAWIASTGFEASVGVARRRVTTIVRTGAPPISLSGKLSAINWLFADNAPGIAVAGTWVGIAGDVLHSWLAGLLALGLADALDWTPPSGLGGNAGLGARKRQSDDTASLARHIDDAIALAAAATSAQPAPASVPASLGLQIEAFARTVVTDVIVETGGVMARALAAARHAVQASTTNRSQSPRVQDRLVLGRSTWGQPQARSEWESHPQLLDRRAATVAGAGMYARDDWEAAATVEATGWNADGLGVGLAASVRRDVFADLSVAVDTSPVGLAALQHRHSQLRTVQKTRFKEVLMAEHMAARIARARKADAHVHAARSAVARKLRMEEMRRRTETAKLIAAGRAERAKAADAAAASAAAAAAAEAKADAEREARELELAMRPLSECDPYDMLLRSRASDSSLSRQASEDPATMWARGLYGGDEGCESDDDRYDGEASLSWMERRKLRRVRKDALAQAAAAAEAAAAENTAARAAEIAVKRERLRVARAAARAAFDNADAIGSAGDSFGSVTSADPVVAAFRGYALGARDEGGPPPALFYLALGALLAGDRAAVGSADVATKLHLLRYVLDHEAYVDSGLRIQFQADAELLAAFASFVGYMSEKNVEVSAAFGRRWARPPPALPAPSQGARAQLAEPASRWPARRACDYISDADILEVHSYRRPPVFVEHVCQALCILLRRPISQARKVQHSVQLLHALDGLSPEVLTLGDVRRLYRLVGSDEFSPALGAEVAAPVARMVAFICDVFAYMVRYHEAAIGSDDGVMADRLAFERQQNQLVMQKRQLIKAQNLLANLLTTTKYDSVDDEFFATLAR
ncbi:breast cancer type 2 susceptibility protein [Thecamonas trahens ATCC 50062]|uniref:Breast cancer type 2 susceptibility protein n=1 Tax=Thecamonas trahens ATCC 50062 TaxID=461836 RepID=A0A0L0DAU5_THETB|nr:breast cancer type 2 susceptibility protein [Thecamonas trahens ATCC 50062]KNC49206.1 breast cancer type 2 susceptibility protein [Thecamonas trahens ATCC 50062]|eukprot:XP_013757929.1 breast cancer type 2 susceptibility protein [Thecamonas trahens ATCC 50062]